MVILFLFLYLSSCQTISDSSEYFLLTSSQQLNIKMKTEKDSFQEETSDYKIFFTKNKTKKQLKINNQLFVIENQTLIVNNQKFFFKEPVYFFSELRHYPLEFLKIHKCIIVFEYTKYFESFNKMYASAQIHVKKQKNALSIEFELEEQIFSIKLFNQKFQGLFWPYQTYGISYGQSF
jgi:hypothetical protein